MGIDVQTHEPIAYRYLDGEVAAEARVTARLQDVPVGHFSFVVPEGGLAEGFPKESSVTTLAVSPEKTLLQARTRRTLGRTPLWLGRMFAGQPLQSIALGVEVLKAPSGARLSTAPFVRYDYGAFSLQEFGARRPSWYRQGPPPGQAVLERGTAYLLSGQPNTLKQMVAVGRAALSRDGLLVLVNPAGPPGQWSYVLTHARALRLIDALRPLPG